MVVAVVSEADEARSATGWGLVLALVSVVAGAGNVAFHAAVARVGGPGAYGGIATLLAAGSVAGVLEIGILYPVARRAATTPGGGLGHAAAAIRGLWVWPATAVLLSIVVALPLAPFLRLTTGWSVVVTGVYCAGVLLNGIPVGVLTGRGRFGPVVVWSITTAVLRLLVLPALLPFGVELAAVGATALAVVISTAGLALHLGGHAGDTSPEGGAGAGLAGASLAGVALAGGLWATWLLPLAFARNRLGTDASGAFAAMSFLNSGVLLVTAPITSAFFPAVARSRRIGTVTAGTMSVVGTAGVLSLLLAIAGEVAVRLLYGAGYGQGIAVRAGLASSVFLVAVATHGVWMTHALRWWSGAAAAGVVGALLASLAAGWLWGSSAATLAWEPGLGAGVGAGVALAAVLATRRRAIARGHGHRGAGVVASNR